MVLYLYNSRVDLCNSTFHLEVGMASVFKKLISRELGEMTYNRYFFCYQKGIANKTCGSKEIYNDMYERLKDKDIRIIKRMSERLNDAMIAALRISKSFLFAFLFYLGISFFLIGIGLQTVFTVIGIILMTICFIFKTYEFIVNKYCFIDAQIILVYKAVLDELILNYRVRSKI